MDSDLTAQAFSDEARAKIAASRAAAARLSPRELISKARLSVKGTQRRQVAKRLLEMPARSRNNYLTAMGGKSMAAGIKSHCMECVCWVRTEVVQCTDLGCPLYPYRPFKGMLEAETEGPEVG